MKGWRVYVIAAIVVLAGWRLGMPDVLAKDKSITLTWTQQLPAPNDLKGWNVYCSEQSGGPYRFLRFVPFVKAQAEYTWMVNVSSLDFKKKEKLYFVVRSVDTEGNESVSSAEVSGQVDAAPTGDTNAPPVPGNVTMSKQ